MINNIKRHKSNKTLQTSAYALLCSIIAKSRQGQKKVIINHNYIRCFTHCRSTKQNTRILNQLKGLIDFKYHKKYMIDDRSKYDVYVIEINEKCKELLKEMKQNKAFQEIKLQDKEVNTPLKKKATNSKMSPSNTQKMSPSLYMEYNNIKDIIDINKKEYPKTNILEEEALITSSLIKSKISKLSKEAVKLINSYCRKFTSRENMGKNLSFAEKREIFGYMVSHVVDWGLEKIQDSSLIEKVRKALNVFWTLFKAGKFKIPVSYRIAKESELEYKKILNNYRFNGVFKGFLELKFKIKRKLGIDIEIPTENTLNPKTGSQLPAILKPSGELPPFVSKEFIKEEILLDDKPYAFIECKEDDTIVRIGGSKYLCKLESIENTFDDKVLMTFENIKKSTLLEDMKKWASSKILHSKDIMLL